MIGTYRDKTLSISVANYVVLSRGEHHAPDAERDLSRERTGISGGQFRFKLRVLRISPFG
jgi:hypothetical protein